MGINQSINLPVSRLSEEQLDVDKAVRSILGKLVWSASNQAGGDTPATPSALGAPGVLGVAVGGCWRLTDRW